MADHSLQALVLNTGQATTRRLFGLMSFVLDAATVIDDLTVDRLFGGGGLDWFLTGIGDVIADQGLGEQGP